MSLTKYAARLYVFAKTTFPHVPWSGFLPDGSLEDYSCLHLRHSPEPTQPVAEPAQAQDARPPLTDEQIEALPVWDHFVGLWPENRKEIVRAIEAAKEGDTA